MLKAPNFSFGLYEVIFRNGFICFPGNHCFFFPYNASLFFDAYFFCNTSPFVSVKSGLCSECGELQDKLTNLATQAHRQYGTNALMEGSGLIAAEPSSDSEQQEDFFSQEFVAHHSNSSSSITRDAFIKDTDDMKGV